MAAPSTKQVSSVRLSPAPAGVRRIGNVLQKGVTERSGSPARSPSLDVQGLSPPVGRQPPFVVEPKATVLNADHGRFRHHGVSGNAEFQTFQAGHVGSSPEQDFGGALHVFFLEWDPTPAKNAGRHHSVPAVNSSRR